MEVRVKRWCTHPARARPSTACARTSASSAAAEPACPCGAARRAREPSACDGDLRLRLGEHVPVVLGLLPQDYLPYTVPLGPGSSPMEVSAVPPPPAAGAPAYRRDGTGSARLFGDPPVGGGLLASPVAGMLPARGRPRRQAPLSPLLPPLQTDQAPRTPPGLWPRTPADRQRALPLNPQPHLAPGVAQGVRFRCRQRPPSGDQHDGGAQEAGQAGLVLGAHHALGGGGRSWPSVPDSSFLVRDSLGQAATCSA